MPENPVEIGCYIDGSHMNSIDFTLAVIDFAVSRGFEIDQEQYRKDIDWIGSVSDVKYLEADQESIDRMYEIMDALDWTYDEALEYLNEIDLHRGYVWVIDEQSLFREKSDD